ncbi:MAG: DNA replication/repair protein RecF [Anaerolineae bacterium]|nr:DNA replication/repair protein RecF [Anaerolineae bacterium]
MHITHLSLTNFRNYGRLELDLSPGPTLLVGDNAQGKTNLLEAVYYMATTRSPHVASDDQLINWEADRLEQPVIVGRIVIQVQTGDGLKQLEMRLIRERRNGQATFRREALVNRRKVRLMDLLGELRVVLFLPEDVGLVTGSPAERRRYIDITLCQVNRTYCRTLSTYNKLLEQRNALLRQLAEQGTSAENGHDVLSVYSEQLIDAATTIFMHRTRFMRDMARGVQRVHYEKLTGGRETLRLRYLPRLQHGQSGSTRPDDSEMMQFANWMEAQGNDRNTITDRFRQALTHAVAHDLLRGSTSVGPHRDDWQFWVNGRNLSSYGSRGQQRSAVLALKLAEIDYVTTTTNDTPILLLDDVMAELDGDRRSLLVDYLASIRQSLITTTDHALFPESFQRQAKQLTVRSGRIEELSDSI